MPIRAASNLFITVETDTLNVRSDPSLEGKVISTIHRGEEYPLEKEEGEWVQISFSNGETGWVANYLVSKKTDVEPKVDKMTEVEQNQVLTNPKVTIQYNGTNIRELPDIHSEILDQANLGDSFYSTHKENNWYAIVLGNGQTGYVAEWLVTVQNNADTVETENPSNSLGLPLQNKKIVIDPGHGGKDDGTTGFYGTLEKSVTLNTAMNLVSKLKNSGANVFLTRNQDQYLSLPSRVNMAYYHDADAFISIHYDSFDNQNIHGITTYFYHSWQKNLAESIHTSLIKKTNMYDRGIHIGDYYVIRENNKKAVLIELGYLSNPSEEQQVTSNSYQELAATGIYEGLVHYFQD